MRIKLLPLAVAAFFAAANLASAADVKTVPLEVRDITAAITVKLKEGKSTEADLAPELKKLDELFIRHRSEKTDEVAQILFTKAMIYVQLIGDTTKGLEIMKVLKAEFGATDVGKRADRLYVALEKQAPLVKGAMFPPFAEKDLAGKTQSIAGLKGKVVLLDFWATWCGPCVAELPNVQETYKRHHAAGFEIVGISLDENKEQLETFIKQKGMTWPQIFDGQGWNSKLAQQYGVMSIPATYLLDGQGRIIAKNLRGEALEKAVAASLAKK